MAAVPSIGRAVRVEGHAAPEADATRALYERYGNQIFGYCLHQLGSREEAEDAVQSTFLNAFRGLRRGVVPEAEQAWLFKIAQNVCLSRRRSSWRRGRIESPSDFELAEETTAAPVRRADELIGLQDVLERMPESQRRAILLREWQGLSYREIADELELSQAAVETLIFRARRALAQGLEASPAEQRSWRARLRPSVGFGNLLGWLQSGLGGGLAVKAAGTAAVVAAGSAAVAVPLHHGVKTPSSPRTHAHRSPAPARARPAAQTAASVSLAPVSRAAESRGVPRVASAAAPGRAARRHAARRSAAPSVPVAATPAPVASSDAAASSPAAVAEASSADTNRHDNATTLHRHTSRGSGEKHARTHGGSSGHRTAAPSRSERQRGRGGGRAAEKRNGGRGQREHERGQKHDAETASTGGARGRSASDPGGERQDAAQQPGAADAAGGEHGQGRGSDGQSQGESHGSGQDGSAPATDGGSSASDAGSGGGNGHDH